VLADGLVSAELIEKVCTPRSTPGIARSDDPRATPKADASGSVAERAPRGTQPWMRQNGLPCAMTFGATRQAAAPL